jgi:nitrate/nitrite transporter NarK
MLRTLANPGAGTLGDHMASSTVSLLRFVSVALAAAALTLGSAAAGALDAVRRWRERDDRSLVSNICAAAAFGVMLTLAGCSEEPEPRAVYAPSATAIAKVRLDPAAQPQSSTPTALRTP